MQTITSALVRDLLETVESADLTDDAAAMNALYSAQTLRRHVEALTRELVADVRAVPLARKGDKIVGASLLSGQLEYAQPTSADRARGRWTWKGIGAVLGVSPQAAQQRYGK